jgi:hypothetical protein
LFGAPPGYNASCLEEHHKAHAKRPGQHSQKSINTIDQQCACRIADTIVIDTVHGLFQERHVLAVDKNRIDTPIFVLLLLALTAMVTIPQYTKVMEQCIASGCLRILKIMMVLVQEGKFTMQTRAPIYLEDNYSMFILQHYGLMNKGRAGLSAAQNTTL